MRIRDIKEEIIRYIDNENTDIPKRYLILRDITEDIIKYMDNENTKHTQKIFNIEINYRDNEIY